MLCPLGLWLWVRSGAKSLVEGCARSPVMNILSSKRPSAASEAWAPSFDARLSRAG